MSKTEHIHLHSVTSTNDEAKRLIRSGAGAPLLVTADLQTAGRGTHGRSFISPEGGLYMSAVLKVKSVADCLYYTALAAVAVCGILREHEHIDVRIKWINDIKLDGKKLAGILCEGVTADGGEYIIVGVGINCKKTVFPEETEKIAASYDGGDPYILSELIMKRLIALSAEDKSDILASYRSMCETPGSQVVFEGRTMTATAIDDDFGLVLSDGTRTFVTRNTR